VPAGWRRRGVAGRVSGASMTTSALAPSMAAETVRAVVRPVVNWPGLPRPPTAEKTDPSTAMPSTVPTWRRVGGAGGDALKRPGSVAEGDPGDGREEETQAGAGDEEGRDEVGVTDGGGDLGGEPADADGLQRDADGDDPPAAEAI